MEQFGRSRFIRALEIFLGNLINRSKFRRKGRMIEIGEGLGSRGEKGIRIDLRENRSRPRKRFLWLEQKWWFWLGLMVGSFLIFGQIVFMLSSGSGMASLTCGIIAGTLGLVVCALFYIIRKSHFQIMRSGRKAERTERELERFIIVLLRGLRLPLRDIKESTKLLAKQHKELTGADSDECEQITETAKAVFSNASGIDEIIHGLLQLRKVHKAEPQYTWLNMNSMVVDIVRDFKKQIDVTSAAVQMKDLPSCLGDNELVKQAFEALIFNALGNLSQEREPVIRIWGWVERDKAFYCVEDNGIGIAEDDLDKIFEIFFTVDPNTKAGKGVGLAIVRRVMERHAGRLWVKSELGEGSTFTVALPVK